MNSEQFVWGIGSGLAIAFNHESPMGLKKSAHKKVSEQCAARIMEALPLAMSCIRADMRARGATEEFTVPQFQTMAFLDKHPGASVTDLSEHLGVTCATASANIERLVQRNFINRSDHPEERRRVVLSLTEAGKHHLEQNRAQNRAYLADLLSVLTEEQIDQISAGMLLLKQMFEQSGESPK